MCPDTELLSAWSDGEVPSPWKERIASHLEGCRSCADRVAGFKRLSLRLRSAGKFDEAALVAKVATRLGIDRLESEPAPDAARTAAVRHPAAGSSPRRHANLALPIPYAAVAAAALLAVGILSGRMIGIPGALARGSAASPLAVATETSALPASLSSGNVMSGNSTMDSLVRYLETQNAPVSITIQLPPNGSFTGGGTPMIVKTPPAESVSLPPSTQGLGFVMSGSGK